MALDIDRWVGAQAIMKCLLDNIPYKEWQDLIYPAFSACMKNMEDYATVGEEDEWVNTGVSIPQVYWNGNNETKKAWLTEWGKTQKDDQGFWYVFCQRKNLDKYKKEIVRKEAEFQGGAK